MKEKEHGKMWQRKQITSCQLKHIFILAFSVVLLFVVELGGFFPRKYSIWQANSSSPLQYYKVKLWPLTSQTKGNLYYSLFSQCFYRNTGIRRATCPEASSRLFLRIHSCLAGTLAASPISCCHLYHSVGITTALFDLHCFPLGLAFGLSF